MDLREVYTQLILEESSNKKNKKELEDATHSERGHNPSCGDEIILNVKIEKGQLSDLSYMGQGCAISQASTSIMIEEVRGMEVEKALCLCDKFIAMIKGEVINKSELGDAIVFENIRNLPARVKCATLPWYTLKNIIEEEISK